MIITLTMNPSVDYLYKLSTLSPGNLNRVELVSKMVGGKGINAARVSSILGTDTIAMGVIGGQNGQYIENETSIDKFTPKFIKVKNETRNCYVILDKNNNKTEINEYGYPIETKTISLITNNIREILSNEKVSIISLNGSLPTNCPSDFYNRLIKDIRSINKDVKVLLDTSGDALKTCLNSKYLPNIIKPNEVEIANLLGISVTTDVKILKAKIEKNDLLSKIPIIFVSLGSQGSLVKYNHSFYKITFPKINAVNTQGSGDSTVGGLLSAIDMQKDEKEIIKYGSAAGTANALNIKTGFIDIEDFKNSYDNVEISMIGE
ncbi:1-phosphofructokinase family hexose kinase [Ligilactobacillus equi]|uniref:Tagatose-6-phosphate kinase n=1 Tax=Ligilactobacillus equi DSM 15833 = JCM 10991 TaxID=1423740 RepID=A0A0R1TNG6_9LACO|nr:hexose kinase [Ligilactobacillus equi]KRL80099.1 tagatose-6-phosphate kinase [Ligilactobacillus equi DSM 15833 = JCM 10991]